MYLVAAVITVVAFIFAVFCFLLVFCVGDYPFTRQTSGPIPGNSFKLSLQELVNFEQKASKGDIEAMKRLSAYYSVYVCDDEKAEFWYSLAAYAGDRDSQEGLVYRLTTSELDSDLEKGSFLANKWRIAVNHRK